MPDDPDHWRWQVALFARDEIDDVVQSVTLSPG